jgi:hypothetical protein
MPFHARVVTVMLAVNAVLSIVPLTQSQDGMTIFRVVVAALLLYGFLRGSEGVRVLLLIGAFIGLLGGVFTTLAAFAVISTGMLGILALALGVWAIAANAYLLFALRNIDVEQWMLRRSLGMDTDG